MAELNVKKNQKEEKAVAKRGGNALVNWDRWDPFAWWRTPSEFFTDPFSVMRRFREEMDRVLARTFGDEFGGNGGPWSPAIEVSQQNGNLRVQAELPGLNPEDIKIEATSDSLIIQGERKDEHEEKGEGIFRSEWRYGKFYREIPLPEGANVDQAKAQFNNGVLQVTLPIPESKTKRREIPIGTGAPENAAPAGEQKK